MNGITSLWDMWSILWDNMSAFVEFMTQPISHAVNSWLNSPFAPMVYITSLPIMKDLIQHIVSNNFLGQISLAEFLLGSGIITILMVNIIKWLIGIIT